MIKTPLSEEQALQRLAALCARSEHSSGEMAAKMRQWGLDEPTLARVMERLIRDRYIDDSRFARAFVHEKLTYNRWGHRKIAQALWAKGIGTDIAQEALGEVGTEDYAAVLRPLIKSKRKTTKARSAYELRMKLTRYALGRGFTMDVVRQCVEGADELDLEDDGEDGL